MSLAIVHTRANQGVDAPLITVETHLSNGLPSLSMVGLPETAVKESRERVRSAIINAGLEFPAQRITINLAPAGVPKSGGRYDLAIALSILAASEQISKQKLVDIEILGELALTGEIRGVQGVLPAVLAARNAGRSLMVPAVNAEEVSLVPDALGIIVPDLRTACQHFNGAPLEPRQGAGAPRVIPESAAGTVSLGDIRGQDQAKRALTIAAAGNHNMLMVGPPGTGKTMLANALRTLLPPLSDSQALEVAAVRSVAGWGIDTSEWGMPPFRAPHHSASSVAITGGGRHMNPGEITLAHAGVLFLDELPEFKRHVLESLREPLEAGTVSISRADYRIVLPASVQLIAAMNPCPCGYLGDTRVYCRCTPDRIARYLEKISGPLLDRIDIQVDVPRIDYPVLMERDSGRKHDSKHLRSKVAECRQRQMDRQQCLNNALGVTKLEEVCALDQGSHQLLKQIVEKLKLSARACHRIIKLARTIADLEGSAVISADHLAEAASYRSVIATGETQAP